MVKLIGKRIRKKVYIIFKHVYLKVFMAHFANFHVVWIVRRGIATDHLVIVIALLVYLERIVTKNAQNLHTEKTADIFVNA